MKSSILCACCTAAALAVSMTSADAQNYPTRPVRLIIPFSPGGAADVPGRILADRMTHALGQQVVIENRPGAGSTIGAEAAAKAAPDGYTLFMISNTHFVSAALYKKLNYDALNDYTPITQATSAPNILIIHPSLPAKNVKELIALAKAQSGKLTYGSSGVGGAGHLAGVLFDQLAGTKMIHVPYKGGAPAIIALVSGEVNMVFATAETAVPQVKAGKIRALGVTTAKRSALLPDLPTIAEGGLPGYEANNWYGLLAPAKTPAAIVERLNREVVKVLNMPNVKEQLFRSGLDASPSTQKEFAAYIKSEMAKWAKVVKASGAKAE